MQSGMQKVKCKGKVQKGKCRVSAERQVQTGNPLRTQTRSVVATTCGYPSAYGKVPHVVAERDFYTDGGSHDYLRVRAESVPTFIFLQKWFRTSAKGETKSNKNKIFEEV